ncbi:YitT family protein [Pseudomonas cichorii]|uniref:YitT family protein n=1 Tax=Pseudomonas cichorii TaxID=36746 RepID=UPI0018E5D24F|nr:YitT family protein [Pseudomonas cichorii]MBI6854365.1 YitT family protein [Pseudomonas cichorii]
MTTHTAVPNRLDTRHSAQEDVFALVIATVLISFSVLMLRQAGVMTGGTAGIALFFHYTFAVPFGVAFFTLNLPFYYLSFRRMGWLFTLKTFCAVGLVSFFSDQHALFIHIDQLQPFYASVLGNLILGVGFLILFRHRASLGGVNILALYLQDKYGFKAGWLQMGVDICVLVASLTFISLPTLVASIVGAVLLNFIIAQNHRSDRYSA